MCDLDGLLSQIEALKACRFRLLYTSLSNDFAFDNLHFGLNESLEVRHKYFKNNILPLRSMTNKLIFWGVIDSLFVEAT